MSKMKDNSIPEIIAEKVRSACVKAAKEGFRDASISGLCQDGAMEAAVSAIQTLDLNKIVSETKKSSE